MSVPSWNLALPFADQHFAILCYVCSHLLPYLRSVKYSAKVKNHAAPKYVIFCLLLFLPPSFSTLFITYPHYDEMLHPEHAAGGFLVVSFILNFLVFSTFRQTPTKTTVSYWLGNSTGSKAAGAWS